MSPLQARMAQLKAQQERETREQEDLILARAEDPDAWPGLIEAARQITDRRNSPR